MPVAVKKGFFQDSTHLDNHVHYLHIVHVCMDMHMDRFTLDISYIRCT